MRNIKMLFLLACACALTACNEDSQNGNSKPSDPPATGESAKIGESCEKTSCEDGLFCENKLCVAHVDASLPCDKTHICNAGLTCSEGTCINEDTGEGKACTDDASCKEGLKCDNSVCKKAAQVGESCENMACIDSECLENICTIYVGENENCARDMGHACTTGLVCHDILQVCYKPLEIGATCDPLDDRCGDNLACHQTAQKCMNNGKLGDDCDESANRSCDPVDNLVCLEGKCRKPSDNSCSEMSPCASKTAVCYEGQCIEIIQCTDDTKCQADTYCCKEEACPVKGMCMPYGKGPHPAVNETCSYETIAGMFEADVQCEWKGPDAPEPYDGKDIQSVNVLMTPLVMNTPHDSGTANEIIFTTYNCTDGGDNSGIGASLDCYGVIRIINGENCKLLESIFDDENRIIAGSTIAMADVDGDKNVEIFASRGTAQKSGKGGGLVAFHWDGTKYVTKWKTTDHSTDSGKTMGWAGPAIHDINNDGIPEVLGYGGEVFNAIDGKRLNPGQTIDELSRFPTVADIDHDGKVEIIGVKNTYRWNNDKKQWEIAYPDAHQAWGYGGSHGYHFAYADFGSKKKDSDEFEYGKFDGIAEIVSCGGDSVVISTLDGTLIFNNGGHFGGGPCTIGDFDGDNVPEVATAFGDYYKIFDPQCTKASDSCMAPGIMWQMTSQDKSSYSTGSSLFDFDGDGKMEAVYADECFTRVYEGKTGEVLFSSYRSSDTWHEYPVIADVDNDESAEIIVGSNNAEQCPKDVTPVPEVYFDPIHRGLRCSTDSDCRSGKCVDKLCRCDKNATKEQCNYRLDPTGKILDEYGCTDPLDKDKAGGSVCRAKRVNGTKVTGIRVMRDRLDRWTSSRNIWNQHVYNITNIKDDQTIPKTSEWTPNFLATDPKLNNMRQNVQGTSGKNAAPDITGKLDKNNLCVQSSESHALTLKGVICNRGTKMVAYKMPASFYEVTSDDKLGKKYCTAYTASNVPVGECLEVSCELENTDIVGKRIRMVANDDGDGGKTTVECIDTNNTDEVLLEACDVN